jgi:hypothetical protein
LPLPKSLLTYDPVRSGGFPCGALHLAIPEQAPSPKYSDTLLELCQSEWSSTGVKEQGATRDDERREEGSGTDAGRCPMASLSFRCGSPLNPSGAPHPGSIPSAGTTTNQSVRMISGFGLTRQRRRLRRNCGVMLDGRGGLRLARLWTAELRRGARQRPCRATV